MPVMVHPKLPGREITVRESAVPTHERSGWKVKPEKPERQQPKKTAEPEAAGEPVESGE